MGDDTGTAAAILRGLGYSVCGLRRMQTGLCHQVFEVELASGGPVVLRLGRPETAAAIRSGVGWHGRLAAVGVPVPALLRHSLAGCRPYMVLERLPGRGLLLEIAGMSEVELCALAWEPAPIQGRLARLPRARGYGHASDYDDPALAGSWTDVVRGTLERARVRLAESGACDAAVVGAVAARLPLFARHMERIEPDGLSRRCRDEQRHR